MIEFLVRYTLKSGIYEARIRTATSGSAISLIEAQHPDAINVSIVSRSDINTSMVKGTEVICYANGFGINGWCDELRQGSL